MTWTDPTTVVPSVTSVSAALWNSDVRDNTLHLYTNLPKKNRVFGDELTLITGDALEETDNDTQHYGYFERFTTPAQNNEVSGGMLLAAGTYTLEVLGVKNTTYGITTVYLDDVQVGTLDWFATPSQVLNSRQTIADLVIATGGWHVLKLKLATKNAGSSNYQMGITKLTMMQASD